MKIEDLWYRFALSLIFYSLELLQSSFFNLHFSAYSGSVMGNSVSKLFKVRQKDCEITCCAYGTCSFKVAIKAGIKAGSRLMPRSIFGTLPYFSLSKSGLRTCLI